jgi:hypothetical protein
MSPPQLLIDHGGPLSEHDKKDHLRLTHGPLRLGEGFIEGLGSDSIGRWVWLIENTFHYLGRVIPIIVSTGTLAGHIMMLFKVGRVYIFFDQPSGSRGSCVVLGPQLAFEHVLELVITDRLNMFAVRDYIITWVFPNGSTVCELNRVRAYYAWERCEHGRDRWREFEARGGQVDVNWWDSVLSKEDEWYNQLPECTIM